MYTEDDDNVKLKNKNSKDYESDFYTSFNSSNDNDNKKNKKKKKNDSEVQNEDDYSDFYGSSDESEEEYEEKNSGVKNIIKIIVIFLLLAVLIILLVILFNNNSSKGDIELAKENYTLKAGDSEYISYKVIGTESNVTSTFTSSDPNVVTLPSFEGKGL